MKWFFIILIISSEFVFSINIDSLKNLLPNSNKKEKLDILLNITKYYDKTNFDSTIKYNKKYLTLAKKENNLKHMARAYANNGYYNVSLGLNFKGKDQIDSSSHYYFMLKDTIRAAFTYNVKARIYENLGNTDSSYYYYSEALKLLKIDSLDIFLSEFNPQNKKDVDRLKIFGIILTDFGLFNVNLMKYDKAEELFRKILEIAEVMNDDRRKAGTYSNLGMIYERRDSSEKAIKYYNQALNYAEKSNAILYKMSIMNNIGVIYSKTKNDIDSINIALKYYKEAADLAGKASDIKSEIVFKLNIAKMLSLRGEYQSAISLMDSINTKIQNLDDVELWSRYYKNLSLINFDENNFKDAYNNVLKSQIYKDSFRNERSMDRINKLQVEFDTERKDYQIELLTKEKELLNNRLILIIGIIAFIMILTLLIYSRYRIKIQAYNEIHSINEQLKQSEAELKELNATKDKFFSIIAHDLKGPIGTYKNVLEFIERDMNKLSKDEIKEFILDLRYSSDRLFSLLEDLLSWSRSQTGKLKFNPDNYNLKEVINNNLSIFSLSADDKNIELKSNLQSDLTANFDITMINTVIRNLLSNAVKFTGENGKIEINAIDTENEVVISVKDNGTGMDESTKNKIFKISEHITSRGTKNEKGTGLGLILCKEFIDKHGGNIWVESEKGIGSEFFFSIPKNKDFS